MKRVKEPLQGKWSKTGRWCWVEGRNVYERYLRSRANSKGGILGLNAEISAAGTGDEVRELGAGDEHIGVDHEEVAIVVDQIDLILIQFGIIPKDLQRFFEIVLF